jgi:hypothetical protein
MTENKINNVLVKLSKKQLAKVLGDLPTVPFDMEEDIRTRRVPKPSSKTHIVIYIRYHWLDSEINGTLKSLKLPFLKEQTAIDDLTKNEIKRRTRILLEREIFRPRFDEIERKFQAQHSSPVRYSPRELYLCGAKQWQQHLERTDREEEKQREERRKIWSKRWVELGLIKG